MVPFRTAAVLASLVLAGIGPATAQEHSTNPATRRFEAGPCPFKADEKILAQVRCGYLIVPENRARPDGRQLRLAVAIARSANATPRPDPVVLLSGGPGDSFVQNTARLMNVVMAGLRADRDLIIWDQRGTGFSEPVFCPELNARWREIGARGLERSARVSERRQALAHCRETMLRQGVDLSQYNTVVSAHDLDDLRRVLGVAQWNLVAISYGTRLALEAMRLAPQGIRSAVLTSPLPPNLPIDVRSAFADVLARLSRACAAQPDCNAAYPETEQSLWAAVRELDQKPVVRRLTYLAVITPPPAASSPQSVMLPVCREGEDDGAAFGILEEQVYQPDNAVLLGAGVVNNVQLRTSTFDSRVRHAASSESSASVVTSPGYSRGRTLRDAPETRRSVVVQR